MASAVAAPNLRDILTPLLPSLPAAAVSAHPAPAILRLLSPILRQRVQLLASSSPDPWLRLLTYDTANAARLADVAHSDRLEPHPVSGEVELDLDCDVQTQYRRLDEETLQALVVLRHLELLVRLVYCANDDDSGGGGGGGWRVGEVGVPDAQDAFGAFAGCPSLAEAERAFAERHARAAAAAAPQQDEEEAGGGGDDADYWARYDATPARSPRPKPSPARAASDYAADADAYFAQYDQVQPAMDNHDPDEAGVAQQLGPAGPRHSPHTAITGADGSEGTNELHGSWMLAPSCGGRSPGEEERTFGLAHPRPESSASSNGSNTVLKLEEQVGRHEQSEFGIKQHVSRSIRSLFILSRAAGIDRDEFERMVKADLDVLGLVDNDT